MVIKNTALIKQIERNTEHTVRSLFLYVLETSKVMSEGYRSVRMRTHGNFILLHTGELLKLFLSSTILHPTLVLLVTVSRTRQALCK